MRSRGLALLTLGAVLLSGCIYYPFTYHSIEADQLNQPFTNMWAVSDPGFLSFSIGDSKRNFNDLRVCDYAFESDHHPILITRVAFDKVRSRNFAIVRFYYKSGTYVDGRPFRISILFDAAGEKLQVNGSFSTHTHTKIENLQEVLDHG